MADGPWVTDVSQIRMPGVAQRDCGDKSAETPDHQLAPLSVEWERKDVGVVRFVAAILERVQ